MGGERRALERRHAEACVAVAEDALERAAGGPVQLTGDVENLAAAADRMREAEPRLAARAALALDAVLRLNGPIEARLRFLRGAIQAAEAAGEPGLLARARAACSEALRVRGQLDEAAAEAEQAIELARAAAARLVEGEAWSALGTARVYAADYEGARRSYQEALACLDDEVGAARRARAFVFMRLCGTYIVEGRFEEAEPAGREALQRLQEAGDPRAVAIALANQGVIHAELGHLAKAAALYEEARAAQRALGDRRSEATLLPNLGVLALEEEAFESALARFEEARELARALSDPWLESYSTGCRGVALARLSRWPEASEALLQGRRLCERRGDALYGTLFRAYGAAVDVALGNGDAARRALGDLQEALEGLSDRAVVPAIRFAHAAAQARLGAFADEEARALLAGPAPGIHARLARRWLEVSLEPVRSAARGDVAAPDRAPAQMGAVPGDAGPRLDVARDGLSFELAGQGRVDLSRRGPMRRVLLALVHARQADPGRPLDVHALLAAGWPGEKVLPEAGANRVYAAIKTLRKLGLEGALVTRDAGYLIAPEVEVALER